MRSWLPAVLVASLALPSLPGCSGGTTAAARPPEWTPPNESKCKVVKSQSRPLIVEWPSNDRVTLESTMKEHVVAVRASGCEVEVLAGCKAPGRYGYRGTTKESDAVSISSEDELFASLPLGAASLSGKLQSSGSLGVNMAVVGRYVADTTDIGSRSLRGDGCDRATHFLSAISVGAFSMYAGGSAEAGGGVGVGGVGAGARSASKREDLKSGGNVASCERASRKDTEPPEGCTALLRIELVPLAPGRDAAPPRPRPPPARRSIRTAPLPRAPRLAPRTPRGPSRPSSQAPASRG